MLFLMYSENQNHVTDLAEHTEIVFYKVVYQRYDIPWKMLQTKDISLVDQSVSQSFNRGVKIPALIHLKYEARRRGFLFHCSKLNHCK
jgi:hypothetical protein